MIMSMPVKPENLKAFLDQKVEEYNTIRFIEKDPISIPHMYTRKEDVEISGFIAATLSWGQRTSILNNSKRLLALMDEAPYDFITQSAENEFSRFLGFVHRTFNGEDCIFLLHALRNVYLENKGMERIFLEGFLSDGRMSSAIEHFRLVILSTPHLRRSAKHISSPSKGSAAKRLNMFLRWMIRKDPAGVDLGIWESLDAASLMCPLDVHSGRVARKLGLLERKQDDWKAVEELTTNLRFLNPTDPVSYDFALFGLGVHEKHEPWKF
jgi:uncharacterized protein (TIGR02757 family)